MAREMLLVDRRRAFVGLCVLVAALLAALVVLVYGHGDAVRSGTITTVTTTVEIAAATAIAAITFLLLSSFVVLRRSLRFKRSLQRAIHRDRTRSNESRSDLFSEFGELGAAIGAYGRALERRGRTIVGRLGATERALRQVVAATGEEVLVLDGAGRVFAASASADRFIETDRDGTRRIVSDPPIRTVLRTLLISVSHEPISVAKTTLFVHPVYVDRPEKGDRQLAFLVLSRREATRPIEVEITGKQKTTAEPRVGVFGSIFGMFRPGRGRR